MYLSIYPSIFPSISGQLVPAVPEGAWPYHSCEAGGDVIDPQVMYIERYSFIDLSVYLSIYLELARTFNTGGGLALPLV